MSGTSVVLATYNGEKYLPAQLQSLVAQTLPPAEIIISDDASNDRTLEIAEAFAKSSSIKTTVSQNARRLGYANNFLQAAKRASEDYISFCDQDDIWHPNKIERSLFELKRSGAYLCVHSVRLINADGQSLGFANQGAPIDSVFDPLTLPPWALFWGFTQTFDKRLLSIIATDLRGSDNIVPTNPLAHDRWIGFLASSLGKVVTIAEPLVDYRQHPSNQFGHKQTALEIAKGMLTETPDRLARHRDISADRAELLMRVAIENDNLVVATAALKANEYWKRLAALFDLRVGLYESDAFKYRLRLMRDLIGFGAYETYVNGGLGRKVFPKDLVLGLLGIRPEYGLSIESDVSCLP
jgi:glycosyltransferase involved in cell wall biosynthesis